MDLKEIKRGASVEMTDAVLNLKGRRHIGCRTSTASQ